QAHHLVVTLAPTEFHGATYEGNVVEIGARGEIARELPKRMLEAEAHLPCPCNRCALLRHRWNLLVPQMQIDEAVADVARRAIRKHEVPVQTAEFDTQNTSGVMGVFDDGLPAAQYAVQPKDELVQPKMTLSPHRRPDQSPLPRFSHGIGCLTARLLQYYNLLICTGFQSAPTPKRRTAHDAEVGDVGRGLALMDRAARLSCGKRRRDVGASWNDGGDAMQAIGLKALGTIIAVVAALGQPAAAQDKVKVGVFPTASSLPYFVAIERGFFKEQNIEPETIRLIGGPPNIAAMISNQIEAAVVLLTIEAMNANLKKPGVAMYIGVHSQSKIYQMEQFVVRTGYAAATLKELKGARIMSAPGPANLVAAKAVLGKVGLNEGDYTIDQLDMSQHVNVMTSETF